MRLGTAHARAPPLVAKSPRDGARLGPPSRVRLATTGPDAHASRAAADSPTEPAAVDDARGDEPQICHTPCSTAPRPQAARPARRRTRGAVTGRSRLRPLTGARPPGIDACMPHNRSPRLIMARELPSLPGTAPLPPLPESRLHTAHGTARSAPGSGAVGNGAQFPERLAGGRGAATWTAGGAAEQAATLSPPHHEPPPARTTSPARTVPHAPPGPHTLETGRSTRWMGGRATTAGGGGGGLAARRSGGLLLMASEARRPLLLHATQSPPQAPAGMSTPFARARPSRHTLVVSSVSPPPPPRRPAEAPHHPARPTPRMRGANGSAAISSDDPGGDYRRSNAPGEAEEEEEEARPCAKPRHYRFTLPDGQVWRTAPPLGVDGTCTTYERQADQAVATRFCRPALYASLCEAHRRRLAGGGGGTEGAGLSR